MHDALCVCAVHCGMVLLCAGQKRAHRCVFGHSSDGSAQTVLDQFICIADCLVLLLVGGVRGLG